MKVLVTGASGFIGNHVVRCLLGNSHEVIASSRTAQSFRNKSWFKDVSYIAHRLEDDPSILTERCGPVDAVVHLAWQGLENYNSLVKAVFLQRVIKILGLLILMVIVQPLFIFKD